MKKSAQPSLLKVSLMTALSASFMVACQPPKEKTGD